MKIFWAGDSTIADNNYSTYPQSGIGQGFRLFLKADIILENHAINGRSTKSFLDENRFDLILDRLQAGDYVFIQFGHNDQKSEDPLRYTEAFGTYQDNLLKMIDGVEERGGIPILITPLSRRWFVHANQLEKNIHGDYPQAMKEVAVSKDIQVVDLYTHSRELLEKLGSEESEKLFVAGDNTHLVYEGAVIFAKIIAETLKGFDQYLI